MIIPHVFSPPIESTLAGFGRYFGVQEQVPGGTFWAHPRPRGHILGPSPAPCQKVLCKMSAPRADILQRVF